MNINKPKLIDLVLLVTFKVFLEISYSRFVYPVFSYTNFTLEINIFKLIESYLFTVFFFILLTDRDDKPSRIALKLLFLLMIVPISSFYALANMERSYYYAFIAGFFLTLAIVKIYPVLKIKKVKNSNLFLFICLAIISLCVYLVLIKENGIPTLKAFTLTSVYEIRGEVDYGLRIISYFVGWVASVINCFLLGLAWHKRRYFSLMCVLCLQLVLYAILAHKSVLLTPFVVLFVIFAVKKKQFMRLTLLSLIGLIFFSYVFNAFNISKLPSSLFIRRVLFVPARVSYNYYDFFSKNPYTYLSQSKVGLGLAKNPYRDIGVANLMGLTYADEVKCHMNTGYMGDAYMNFGFAGMLIFSYLLGLMLIIADSVAKNVNICIAIAAMIIPIQKLVNGALFTCMLTNGFILSLLVVWLYKERSRRRVFDSSKTTIFHSLRSTWWNIA